jgi:hypothetical protein
LNSDSDEQARPELCQFYSIPQHSFNDQRDLIFRLFDNIDDMPKQSRAIAEMPPIVQAYLRELGANLSIACKRRKESRKTWAGRMGVSEPTLGRMERG